MCSGLWVFWSFYSKEYNPLKDTPVPSLLFYFPRVQRWSVDSSLIQISAVFQSVFMELISNSLSFCQLYCKKRLEIPLMWEELLFCFMNCNIWHVHSLMLSFFSYPLVFSLPSYKEVVRYLRAVKCNDTKG